MATDQEDVENKPLQNLPSTLSFVWLDRDEKEQYKFKKSYADMLGIDERAWSYYNNKESFLQFLKSLKPPLKVILISSGSMTEKIIEKIHHLEPLYSVYIFCRHIPAYQPLAEKYSKIATVQSDSKFLYQKLRTDLAPLQAEGAARIAEIPPKHSRHDPNREDKNVESFAQPGSHWCPWNSKTALINFHYQAKTL